MRVALICVPLPGEGPSPLVLGRSVSLRQFDFARQCGAEQVILFGNGAGRDALDIRHEAEAAGLRVQVVASVHALGGAISSHDELLVLQPGLLPLSTKAIGPLGKEPVILTLESGAGTQAGFERIDLERAWAGAALYPASLLQELQSLPEDSDPAPALLRIGMQARMPEARLATEELDGTGWRLAQMEEQGRQVEKAWLQSLLEKDAAVSVSALGARHVLRMAATRLAGEPRARLGSAFVMALLLIAALVSAWAGFVIAAFLLVALSVPLAEFAIGLAALAKAPFERADRWRYLRLAIDASLLGCAAIAIGGEWYRAALAPIAVVTSLLLLDHGAKAAPLIHVTDRGAIALLAAILCALFPAEPVFAGLAIVLLLLNLVPVVNLRG